MTLKSRIQDEMKDAMRAKDASRLSTIRLLLAAIGASSRIRLACQAAVRDGAGTLRLRWIGSDPSKLYAIPYA